MATVLPNGINDIINWFEARIGGWTTNKAKLGFSDAQITALTAAITDARTNYTDYEAARIAAKDAKIEMETSATAMEQLGRAMITQVKAKAKYDNDPNIYAAASIPAPSAPTPVVPQTPTQLVATPQVDSTVILKWKRNGNPQGVIFKIETSTGNGVWQFLTDTTRASIALSGYAPGVQKFFRVSASKSGLVSQNSNEAVIYPSGGSLQLAA
jgi:hypothetical protein